MEVIRKVGSSPKDYLFGILVLTVSFLGSCVILSVELGGDLAVHLIGYSTILLLSVRLCNKAIKGYLKSLGEVTGQILGNATGILIGTCVILLLEKLLLPGGGFTVVIIFSSIMTFFILGTFSTSPHKSSVVRRKSSSF